MYGLNDDIKKFIDNKIEKNKTFLKTSKKFFFSLRWSLAEKATKKSDVYLRFKVCKNFNPYVSSS